MISYKYNIYFIIIICIIIIIYAHKCIKHERTNTLSNKDYQTCLSRFEHRVTDHEVWWKVLYNHKTFPSHDHRRPSERRRLPQ